MLNQIFVLRQEPFKKKTQAHKILTISSKRMGIEWSSVCQKAFEKPFEQQQRDLYAYGSLLVSATPF
jgi:hypothetical protein